VTTTSDQKDWLDVTQKLNQFTIYSSQLRNEVTAADTLQFDASGSLTGRTGQAGTGRKSK
jgi:hypothetical protein